ncbi:MAG: peroxide stress protein YaaA [Lachnospiraceae bacterium]|nr:peroxide stress protein YaaA [Lachnospiraceae bacterium]
MKIIISPAKKMNVDTDTYETGGLPEFIEDTRILMNTIKALPIGEAKSLWKCNDKLARLNYERFQTMDLERALTPAVIAYEGLQYQHMAPGVFTTEELCYIAEHLYILSGFYGLLKPFDGVVPYRLEMQAKLSVNGSKDLYDFWGNRLYKALSGDDGIIINLASKEYAKCIEKYITTKDRFLTVEFGVLAEGKVRQKGTLAKMARGEMVRFMAQNRIETPEGMKEFCGLGFSFSRELSGGDRYVFLSGAGGPDTCASLESWQRM